MAMKIEELLEHKMTNCDYKNIYTYRLNLGIPEDIERFNDLLSQIRKLNVSIVRYPSEYINRTNNLFRDYYNQDVAFVYEGSTSIMIYFNFSGWIRISINRNDNRSGVNEINKYNGSYCFNAFKNLLAYNGIDLTKYYRDFPFKNNAEKKKWWELNDYPKQLREFYSKEAEFLYTSDINSVNVIDSCHHLDLNSAYFSVLAKDIPEFHNTIAYLYRKRKEDDHLYKDILTMSWGFFQSQRCGEEVGKSYALTHLAIKMLDETNIKLRNIARVLELNGRIPLFYNVDGIWYRGEVYHDDNEGVELGQWKNDVINSEMIIKSPSAYLFKKDGKWISRTTGFKRHDNMEIRDIQNWLTMDDEELENLSKVFFDWEDFQIHQVI